MGDITASLEEQERRIQERVASGLMSKEEAAKEVIEEMAQEVEERAAELILRAATSTAEVTQEPLEGYEERMKDSLQYSKQYEEQVQDEERKVQERVASGLMSKEEAAKDIAALRRRFFETVIKAEAAPSLPVFIPFIGSARSEKAERVFRRYAALSPNMWYIRSLFEFLLPILVGLYAIYTLLGG